MRRPGSRRGSRAPRSRSESAAPTRRSSRAASSAARVSSSGTRSPATSRRSGPRVDTLREGDLVAVEPHLYCGRCRYCRRGLEHLCPSKRAFGVHLDGGMADAVIAARAHRLPRRPGARPVHRLPRRAARVRRPRDGSPRADERPAGARHRGGSGRASCSRRSRLAGLAPIVVVDPDGASTDGRDWRSGPTRRSTRRAPIGTSRPSR